MADPRSGAARESAQQALLEQENGQWERALNERDHRVSQLNKSNEALVEQVHQLKALVKDVHVRYEDDLQRTVASLQEQYNSALELLQIGAGLAAHDALDGQAPGLSLPKPAATGVPSASGSGVPSTRAIPHGPRPTGHCHQRPQQAAPGGACRCGRPGRHACGSKGTTAQHKADRDPRFGLLGLDPDDFAPSTAYGASVGLVTEPVAVLRDVLNLDGAHDRDRQQQRERPASTGGGAVGVSGPQLAQAQFESRLRGAYRSMLLQLQHRYQLDKERQEDRHKLELQEQEERHCQELSELAAAHEAELVKAAERVEQEVASRRADVQRLQAQLAAAKAAAETSQSQVTAAKAATEALQAQLQLMRSTHEAELQHVRQGSMSLLQHEEVVQRLKAEWNEALQQRERDYNALLGELIGLRRQLSSVGEPSRSSGNSCGHGSPSVSPRDGARPRPAPAASRSTAAPLRDTATASGTWVPAPAAAAPQPGQQNRTVAQAHHPQQQPRQQQPLVLGGLMDGYGILDSEGCSRGGGGLRAGGRGRDGGPPGSPAGSGCSVALSLDEHGSAVLDVSVDGNATPHSRGILAPGSAAADGMPPHLAPPPADVGPSRPPSSASSRLTELVDALVQGGPHPSGTNTNTFTNNNNSITDGRKPALVGITDCQDVWARPNEGRLGGGLGHGHTHGAATAAGARVGGSYGSGPMAVPYSTDERPAGAAGGGGGDGGEPPYGGGSSSRDQRPGSPEQHSSEVTLDHWQLGPSGAEYGGSGPPWEAPRPGQGAGPSSSASGRQRQHPRPILTQPQPSQPQPAAGPPRQLGPGGRDRSPPGSPVRVGARAGGGGAGGGSGGGGAGPAAPPPARAAPGSASAWGGSSGNPATAVHVPRCLRCGLNDATSPGCCRFHPALLSDPGSLRFTPEWMTCHAADHTARTPGCFIRSEHFYEPVRYPAPARSGPSAGFETGMRTGTGASPPSSKRGQAAEDPAEGCVLSGSRRRSGGGAGTAAAGGPQAGGRTAAWGRAVSPPARAGPAAAGRVVGPRGKSRSPGRGASGLGGVAGGGAGGAGAGAVSPGGSDSPSPQPRARLPSPLRR